MPFIEASSHGAVLRNNPEPIASTGDEIACVVHAEPDQLLGDDGTSFED